MQLVGGKFAEAVALAGNDFATFPDFPAEIRAPAGSLAGVSAFQLQFAHRDVFTPGDTPDVLVAMNPAALKTNLSQLKIGGAVILNSGAFSKKNLEHAGYHEDPRNNGIFDAYRLLEVDISGLTLAAVDGLGLSHSAALRCKNFFALGLLYWLYSRDPASTLDWIASAFGERHAAQRDANIAALKAGYHYGETQELFAHRYTVARAELAPGLYRDITGSEAMGLGLLAAADRSGLDLLLATYPITPASNVLHYLSGHADLGVRTFQAEDEIAAMGAAIGAAYAGALAATTTSGPGLALKSEALGLAVSLELPLLVFDVQRGGPSTGLPTKTEQSDLLQACFGRSGEAPLPVLAAKSPGDAFWITLEAARTAIRHMTPVIVLADGYLANGSEPWPVPRMEEIARIPVTFATDAETFFPFARDEHLARPWALPGTPGLEHRIGGLEKEDISGNVSYDPLNHQRMTDLRAEKIRRVAESIPATEVYGDADGDLAVVGWGGTYGAIREAVSRVRAAHPGWRIGQLHLRYLNPLPPDLAEILWRFQRILVPELNQGQLTRLLRAEYLVDARVYSKMHGQPFKIQEIERAMLDELGIG